MTSGARAAFLAVVAAPAAAAQVESRTVGSVTFRADLSHARPGGLIVARLDSRGRLGRAFAILDGRRAAFYASAQGLRALVPLPAEGAAGPNTLGFELWSRRGRQRIPLDVEIAAADYPRQSVSVPESRRALMSTAGVVTESRELLLMLRTESPERIGSFPFRPPVGRPAGDSFGSPRVWLGGSPVETLMDGQFGDRHRGLDYDGAGQIAQAPAAALVLFAGSRTLTGGTVVLDHGQGVVSLFAHLARVDVRAGDRIEPGAPIGLSGDTGLAFGPHLHWAVYLHGVAVDPRVFESLAD
jgi:murein DD-endopeptidase MepM/ murein hydrolase activator NlpD